MLISFVVVARNELAKHLDATIEGIVHTAAHHPFEIIVIDDGSSSPVHLDQEHTRLIRNPTPIGTCQSRRMGASLASGEILVSMDAHMTFAPDWLEEMLAHVDTGAILCAAWWDYELTRPLCWGADFLWCSERDYNAGLCPGLSFRHRTVCPDENPQDVPMLIGACYMLLKASYDKLGGFSPLLRTWGRLEQDLSIRAWLVGLGVKCVPSAHVGHFSRPRFPYPVRWEDLEFNQLAIARTVFEQSTARMFEELLQPMVPEVRSWLEETSFAEWRTLIQSRREISDSEFFKRFVPDLPDSLAKASRGL